MPTTDVPRVLRRTQALCPLDTLVRLFFLGLPVKIVRGDYSNIKITTVDDLAIAEHLLQADV